MSDAAPVEPTLVELAESLLSIRSETGNEGEIADFVERRMSVGSPHALVRAGHNLCVVPREHDAERKTLMLVGHLDTVPELDANPVRREGDRLFGLGASDMKAADALIMSVVLRAMHEPSRHNLVGVFYAAEEGPFVGSGMPEIYKAAKPWFDATDLAICMEPTDNNIELGCLGTCHARVTFEGRRAHSARPWQGENAIHKGAGLLQRLAEAPHVTHTYHDLDFVEAMSATMVEYRGARNVVPDRFVVNVNYRFAPGKTEDDVRQRLDEIVAGDGTYEVVDFCPAGRVCGDNSLLGELVSAIDGADVRAKQAWTDVGRLSHLGIDAINWGPGAIGQAHQSGEWVSLADLGHSARALDRLLFAGATAR